MSTFADSYVSRVLFASPAPGRVWDLTARRWRRLTTLLFDPYRPELHYMCGPGPKWRAKWLGQITQSRQLRSVSRDQWKKSSDYDLTDKRSCSDSLQLT